jgi:hypothetical protein
MTNLETLRQVVIDEARKVAAYAPFVISASDNLCLAVRALERHELRIAQLDTQLDAETAKVVSR